MAYYAIDLQYHPDKINVALDSLSRKLMTIFQTRKGAIWEDQSTRRLSYHANDGHF